MTNTLTPERVLQALDYMLVACGPSPKMDDGTPCYDLIRKAFTSLPSPPVSGEGVTLPRDLAVLAQNVLFRNGFVSADDIEKAVKEYDARLSAAIGERG